MAFTFTDENVKETIASGKPVVIDFWATWCGPCKAMTPIVEKLAEEYADRVIIGKYNTDEWNEFCVDNKVCGLPTVMFFKNGEPVSIRLTGLQKESTLREKIDELLAL